MDKPQIVISGSIALDRIMTFSGHYKDLIEPAKLHVLSVSVLVDSAEQAQGGIAANIASNLAFLGEKPVLVGSVGHDAKEYMDELAARGIDTTTLHYSQLQTASFNVLNDSGGNQVGGFYPGAMGDAESLSFQPWAGQNTLFWIAPHDPAGMRRQVKECLDGKLRLVYDPGQQASNVSGDDLRAGVDAAEVMIINEYELEVLLNKTGLKVDEIKTKVPVFITTFGEQGSEVSGSKIGEAVRVGSVKPAQIVDPTGAGDGYRGGFFYGYLQQWDVAKCGQLGAVVASFVLEQHGPQAKLDRAAIMQRYKENFNEEIEL
jgi:adenosine kinase